MWSQTSCSRCAQFPARALGACQTPWYPLYIHIVKKAKWQEQTLIWVNWHNFWKHGISCRIGTKFCTSLLEHGRWDSKKKKTRFRQKWPPGSGYTGRECSRSQNLVTCSKLVRIQRNFTRVLSGINKNIWNHVKLVLWENHTGLTQSRGMTCTVRNFS